MVYFHCVEISASSIVYDVSDTNPYINNEICVSLILGRRGIRAVVFHSVSKMRVTAAPQSCSCSLRPQVATVEGRGSELQEDVGL